MFNRCDAVPGAPLQYRCTHHGGLAGSGQQAQFNGATVEHGIADLDGIAAVFGKLQALRGGSQRTIEEAEVSGLGAVDVHAQAALTEQAFRRAVVLRKTVHQTEINLSFADVQLAFFQGLGRAGDAEQ